MAAVDIVRLEEVQQWLEETKLRLGNLDDELVGTAKTQVFARLNGTFDTTTWTNYSTTPDLIRKIISLYVAAWTYARQYSEATAEQRNQYASWLESRADALLEGVLAGDLELIGISGADEVGQPAFWPDDTTGAVQQYDAAGNAIGGQYSEDIKFSMGKVF